MLAVEASKDPDPFGSGFLEVEVLRSIVVSSLEASKHYLHVVTPSFIIISFSPKLSS